jgi:hypothetical protein
LYVKQGALPAVGNADCSSATAGTNTEACSFPSPEGGGTYNILVYGKPATGGFSGATLSATYLFAGSAQTLTVSKAGQGSGTVSSSPVGISCGLDCKEPFASGATVTLTATAAAGSKFRGWSGVCSGTGTCTLTMSTSATATATFDKNATTTPILMLLLD